MCRGAGNGELDRNVDQDVRPCPRSDPYMPLIFARLEAYPKLSAALLIEEVQAVEYPGSYNGMKLFVREACPRPLPRAGGHSATRGAGQPDHEARAPRSPPPARRWRVAPVAGGDFTPMHVDDLATHGKTEPASALRGHERSED